MRELRKIIFFIIYGDYFFVEGIHNSKVLW